MFWASSWQLPVLNHLKKNALQPNIATKNIYKNENFPRNILQYLYKIVSVCAKCEAKVFQNNVKEGRLFRQASLERFHWNTRAGDKVTNRNYIPCSEFHSQCNITGSSQSLETNKWMSNKLLINIITQRKCIGIYLNISLYEKVQVHTIDYIVHRGIYL